MPSSTTLPEPTAPLPGASAPAAGASQFDRMQAELKAVQQQALATQQSLQQLEARKPVDAYSAITSHLPGFSTVDSAVLGVGSALVLAAVVIWGYVWQRPRTHWIDAGARRMPVPQPQAAAAPTAPPSAQPSQIPLGETEGWAPSTASGEFSTHGFEPSTSPFARHEPNMAFDSEAAASEVMRVRKSLAEKREARAHFLEREDAVDPDLDPDLDLDLDLDEVPPPAAALQPAPEPKHEPAPEPDALDLDLDLDVAPDPWRQPGESTPGTGDAQPGDAIHFSLALEDYGVQPEPAPEPDLQPPYAALDMDLTPEAVVEIEAVAEAPPVQTTPAYAPEPDPELVLEVEHQPPATGAKTYDYTITMALAEESAALELWTEARDLAAEVLASDNAALVAQAQALLERLNQLEQDAPPDTNWSTVR